MIRSHVRRSLLSFLVIAVLTPLPTAMAGTAVLSCDWQQLVTDSGQIYTDPNGDLSCNFRRWDTAVNPLDIEWTFATSENDSTTRQDWLFDAAHDQGLMDAIRRGADAWSDLFESANNHGIHFIYVSPTSLGAADVENKLYKVTADWDDVPAPQDTRDHGAVTRVTPEFVPEGAGYRGVFISSFSIFFDFRGVGQGGPGWDTDVCVARPGNCPFNPPTTYSLHTAAAHEFGHALGLVHYDLDEANDCGDWNVTLMAGGLGPCDCETDARSLDAETIKEHLYDDLYTSQAPGPPGAPCPGGVCPTCASTVRLSVDLYYNNGLDGCDAVVIAEGDDGVSAEFVNAGLGHFDLDVSPDWTGQVVVHQGQVEFDSQQGNGNAYSFESPVNFDQTISFTGTWPMFSVSGRYLLDGTPYGGASVLLDPGPRCAGTWPLLPLATTQADGTFTFDDVPAGFTGQVTVLGQTHDPVPVTDLHDDLTLADIQVYENTQFIDVVGRLLGCSEGGFVDTVVTLHDGYQGPVLDTDTTYDCNFPLCFSNDPINPFPDDGDFWFADVEFGPQTNPWIHFSDPDDPGAHYEPSDWIRLADAGDLGNVRAWETGANTQIEYITYALHGTLPDPITEIESIDVQASDGTVSPWPVSPGSHIVKVNCGVKNLVIDVSHPLFTLTPSQFMVPVVKNPRVNYLDITADPLIRVVYPTDGDLVSSGTLVGDDFTAVWQRPDEFTWTDADVTFSYADDSEEVSMPGSGFDFGFSTWGVKLPPTNTTHAMRMHVRLDSIETGVLDAYSGAFMVAPSSVPPELLAPDAGTRWATGTTQTIDWWRTFLVIGNHRAELSTDGGGNWRELTAPGDGTFNADESFDWNISEDLTTAAKVRVSTTWPLDRWAEMESGPFEIGYGLPRIVSPNGGEVLAGNSVQRITFHFDGTYGGSLALDYRPVGGNWTACQGTPVLGADAFDWIMPDALGQFELRLTSTTAYGTESDVTDAPFTFDGVTLPRLLSPNGGENWYEGSSHLVQWTYDGAPPSGSIPAQLLVSRNGGPWVDIGAQLVSPQSSTSATWAIPNPGPPGTYRLKVRITDGATGLVEEDESDQSFHVNDAPPPQPPCRDCPDIIQG